MASKLYKVSWPAGQILVHAQDEEKALDVAVKYLRTPAAPRMTATQVLISEEKPTDAVE
jgi:hypothetical protein